MEYEKAYVPPLSGRGVPQCNQHQALYLDIAKELVSDFRLIQFFNVWSSTPCVVRFQVFAING